MEPPLPPYLSVGTIAGIRRPTSDDRDEFVAMVLSSRELHWPWVEPPVTGEQFDAYLASRRESDFDGFLVCDLASGRIAGVINIGCIVRRSLHSAYLGYYGSTSFAGRGYMTEGLKLVTKFAFNQMELHRLEANIQPQNLGSIALAKKCGFRLEGFSPRYLKVMGEWRDHERWALLAE